MTRDGVVHIPLRNNKGEIVAHALIDLEDADQAKHRWYRHDGGYAARNSPMINGKRDSPIFLHCEILELTRGCGLQGDHIDRNPLNCCRANLRVVTSAQNSQNKGSKPGSTSIYRGVSRYKSKGKSACVWQAYARLNGRTRYLGIFEREEDAAAAASAFRAQHMPFSVEPEVFQNV